MNRPPATVALALGMVIVLATIVAYWPAMAHGGFVWDDDDYITSNVHLRDVSGLAELWKPRTTHQYYPLVFTSFWLEHQLWGLNPRGYHVTNVLLHIASALLVWRLFTVLRVPGAWMIGAVFALHPVHAESVAWATERKNVLSALFYLLGALSYLRFDRLRFEARRSGAHQPVPTLSGGGSNPPPRTKASVRPEAATERSSQWWYAASLACLLAALLSKTVTCSLPAALMLALLFLRRRLTVARLLPLVPMFVMGLVPALLTAHLERTSVGAVGAEFDFSAADRLLIACKALLFYPLKLVWPFELSFIYQRWDLDVPVPLGYWPLLAVALIAAACAVLFLRGRRGVPLALAFFAGTLVPALGFFNVYPMRYSFVADHFQYLASLGVIALLVGAIARRAAGNQRFRSVVAAVFLAALAALTWREATKYQSAQVLFERTIASNPRCWMCHNNLGTALMRAERFEEAVPHFLEALRENSAHFQSRSNLAACLDALGRPEEAIEHWALVVAHASAVAEDHYRMGLSFEKAGRFEEAAGKYRDALALHEGHLAARLHLAEVLVRLERPREAVPLFESVLARDPANVMLRVRLGRLCEEARDCTAAVRLYTEGLQRAGNQQEEVVLAFGLAHVLALCPEASQRDPQKALELARSLASITEPDDPLVLDILAAALAGTGDLAAASETAERAVAGAQRRGLHELAAAITERLDKYRSGAKP